MLKLTKTINLEAEWTKGWGKSGPAVVPGTSRMTWEEGRRTEEGKTQTGEREPVTPPQEKEHLFFIKLTEGIQHPKQING